MAALSQTFGGFRCRNRRIYDDGVAGRRNQLTHGEDFTAVRAEHRIGHTRHLAGGGIAADHSLTMLMRSVGRFSRLSRRILGRLCRRGLRGLRSRGLGHHRDVLVVVRMADRAVANRHANHRGGGCALHLPFAPNVILLCNGLALLHHGTADLALQVVVAFRRAGSFLAQHLFVVVARSVLAIPHLGVVTAGTLHVFLAHLIAVSFDLVIQRKVVPQRRNLLMAGIIAGKIDATHIAMESLCSTWLGAGRRDVVVICAGRMAKGRDDFLLGVMAARAFQNSLAVCRAGGRNRLNLLIVVPQLVNRRILFFDDRAAPLADDLVVAVRGAGGRHSHLHLAIMARGCKGLARLEAAHRAYLPRIASFRAGRRFVFRVVYHAVALCRYLPRCTRWILLAAPLAHG